MDRKAFASALGGGSGTSRLGASKPAGPTAGQLFGNVVGSFDVDLAAPANKALSHAVYQSMIQATTRPDWGETWHWNHKGAMKYAGRFADYLAKAQADIGTPFAKIEVPAGYEQEVFIGTTADGKKYLIEVPHSPGGKLSDFNTSGMSGWKELGLGDLGGEGNEKTPKGTGASYIPWEQFSGLPQQTNLDNINPKGGDFFGSLIPAIAIGALTWGAGSALSGALSSSLGATGGAIAGHAIAGGVSSALTGGDPLKGAVMGGIGGGISGWSPMGGAANSFGNTAIRGALTGGASAALNGRDVGEGLLTGGLSTAIGGYVGDAVRGATDSKLAGQIAGGFARSGTGLLAGYVFNDEPDSPSQPTQQKTTATGYAPIQDMSGMNMRQRLAASMRSY